MLFLLRLRLRKTALSPPTNGGPILRALSPAGGSTLITSAPASPSCIEQNGTHSPCVTSTTRNPARLPCALIISPFASLAGRCRDAEFGQHLACMLTGKATGSNRSGGSTVEFPREAVHVELAPMRRLDLDDMAVGDHLRMVAKFVEGEERAVGHLLPGETDNPPCGGFGLEARGDNRD